MNSCLDCKNLCYDELYDSETGEECDMSYCKIGKETDGYDTKACDDFEHIKEESSNEINNM